MKITVIWKNLHFNYHLKVLTTASRIWVDRRVVENQQVKVPSLPNPDSVNNECTKAAILTFWKIVLEIPDTVTTPFVFCWNLEFTRVKPSRVFILFCGICETLELHGHASKQFLVICCSKWTETPGMPLNVTPVLLISSFCRTTPEMPCGKLPVLLVSSFAEQQPQRCHV